MTSEIDHRLDNELACTRFSVYQVLGQWRLAKKAGEQQKSERANNGGFRDIFFDPHSLLQVADNEWASISV